MSKYIEGNKPTKEVEEFAKKLANSEVKLNHPNDAPVFINEEMVKDSVARGETHFNDVPNLVQNYVKKKKGLIQCPL